MSQPRILLLDIETSPNIAYVWGLFNQTIPIDRIVEAGRTLCFSAKWEDERTPTFYSEWTDGRDVMLASAWQLLDEADIVVHYNGTRFDIPTLNKEFVLEGDTPPSPYQHIDLLPVVRQNFRFASNKLDFVCQQLGLGAKTHHKGFGLWTGVLNEEPAAQRKMERYNVQDVRLLSQLYNHLLPWLGRRVNRGVFSEDGPLCTKCGSRHITYRGYQVTKVGKYRRFVCNDCGGWSRDATNLLDLETRRAISRPV